MWPTELPDEKPLWKIPVTYKDGYDAGFAAGRAYQAEKSKGAVIKYADECYYKNPGGIILCVNLPKLIAALEAVGKEGK